MPMDCLRTNDSVVVRFDLPGIEAESLDVSAENNTLTVRAERRLTGDTVQPRPSIVD